MGETGWKGFIAPLGVPGVLPKAIGAPNGHTYDRAKPWTKRRLKIPASGGIRKIGRKGSYRADSSVQIDSCLYAF
jgi:hypothetical protein